MSLLSFLPVLIIFSGAYFLFKLHFFFIKRPLRTLKFAFSGKNKKKSILSLLLALAGTLGVGNIFGVAIGIASGGAGSVLWLIVSAFFSSAIKYAEVFISYRKGGTGMIEVIRGSFGTSGAFFSSLYAILVIILSFSMGSAFQASAISDSAASISDKSVFYVALTVTAFCITVTILGADRIKGAVAIIIPLATIIYTGMCLGVIFSNSDRIGTTVSNILSSAFSPESAAGGILGFIVGSGMKDGFARGLLSNEAGAGTSSLSHTSHRNGSHTVSEAECMRAGIYGIIEVFFDTLLLCPLTALAVLLSCEDHSFDGSLRELGAIFGDNLFLQAPFVLLMCIIFFAVSTTLCWYYYGRVALKFIFPNARCYLYSIFFFFCFLSSMLFKLPCVLFITDTALFILSVISLSALIKNRALIRYKEDALGKGHIDL